MMSVPHLSHRIALSLCLSCGLILAVPTQASDEEITLSIQEALTYYQDGELSEAVTSLQYAIQLIQQQKGGALADVLPEPLPGWEVMDNQNQSGAGGMMGGVMVSRDYRRGSSSLTVSIVTDSPMMQAAMMMMANPMMASSQGGTMERIGKHKGVVNYDTNRRRGDLNLVIANRYLVQVDGNDIDKQELIDYAKAVDTSALASLP